MDRELIIQQENGSEKPNEEIERENENDKD